MNNMTKPPKVFISYAWEDDLKTWVLDFATRLRSDGINAILDQWEIVPGDQLTEFMEKSVRESDFVVFVCTPTYKRKSDRRKGGVGYEGHIITGEVFQKNNHRKFIPVLRKGKWASAAPSWATSKLFIDFRDIPYSETSYQQLLNTLFGKSPTAPPILDDTLREKEKRETAEKIEREKAEREAAKQAESQKLEQEAAEKVVREKVEREAVEKAAREKAERESAEKAERDRIAKERLEKAEQQAAEKAAREKAEREVEEKKARDKNNELAERARLEAEKLNAKKQAGKKAIEKAPLEAGKQETSKITETDTKIKPWIAYGGAISIGLFFGILSVLVLVIPDVAGLNLSWDPFEYLLFAFYVLAGVWLVVTRRGLAFFLSYIVWFLFLILAEIVRSNYDIPFNIVLFAFFLYGFVGLVIVFFLLKISVMKKLFSKILLCCVLCVILLFIVFLGSDAMLGFIGMPLESSYGLLPYVFVYFLFCSFFGNWLRQVFKNRLPSLFAEN